MPKSHSPGPRSSGSCETGAPTICRHKFHCRMGYEWMWACVEAKNFLCLVVGGCKFLSKLQLNSNSPSSHSSQRSLCLRKWPPISSVKWKGHLVKFCICRVTLNLTLNPGNHVNTITNKIMFFCNKGQRCLVQFWLPGNYLRTRLEGEKAFNRSEQDMGQTARRNRPRAFTR